MSRYNPYAVDPNLVQGFNNLTRALIGSSGTDKDMSAVRANDALTSKRNQEEKNIAQQYGFLEQLNNSITNTSASEPFQNAIAQLITGKSLFTPQDAQMTDEYFEAGEAMDASNLGIESPADVATPLGQYRQGDPVLSDLARTFFGDLKYTPNQLSSAFGNIGTTNQENARNNELVDIILNGTPEQSALALRAYSKRSGEFDNPEYALEKLTKTLASDEKQSKYAEDQKYNASTYRDDLMYGKGGQGDRDANLKDSWERHKIAVEDARNKYEIDEKNKVAVKKFEKEQEVIKYKHDNRTIEIQVGKDGRAYIDPITAQKMVQQGQSPNFDEETGLFYLDGQKSPEKIKKIEVGDKDVWMSAETAKIFGVEENAEGKFIIKGKPKDSKSGGSGGGSSSSAALLEKTDNYDDVYSKTIGMENQLPNYDKLPQAVRGKVKSSIYGIITGLLGSEDNTLSEAQLITSVVSGTIGQGFTEITEDRNFSVPTFLITGDDPATKEEFIALGYTKDQARRIMNYIANNR